MNKLAPFKKNRRPEWSKLSLFRRMAIFYAIAIIVAAASGIIINKLIILKSYASLEEKFIAKNIVSAEKIINNQSENLNKTCVDWARWDDAYTFMKDKNPGFIDRNFADAQDTMSVLNINFIIFSDSNSKIIYESYFDTIKNEITSPLPGLRDIIKPGSIFFGRDKDNNFSTIKGLVKINGKVILLCSSPILTSTGGGPSEGILIMGYNFNEVFSGLSEITGIKTNLFSVDSRYFDNSTINSTDNLNNPSDSGFHGITYPDSSSYYGFKGVNDIYGEQSIMLRIEGQRDIYNYGKETANIKTVMTSATALLIGILSLLFLNLYFFKRTSKLSKAVEIIGYKKDLSKRIEITGEDEISSLETSINKMLSELQRAQAEISRTQKLYQDLFENSIDGIYRSSLLGQYIDVNNALVRMLGYKDKNELLSINTMEIYCYPDDRPEAHEGGGTYTACIRKKNGIKIYVEISLRTVLENETPVFYEGIVRDITERKIYEEKIKHMSFHDSLTGLYNRAYFDEEIKRLGRARMVPLTLVLGDVNNLKKVNDSFGHKKGDLLLKKIAYILKDCFRNEDTIARIGGDEFCIILPNTSFEDAEKICTRVSEKCFNESLPSLPLSISFGIKTKASTDKKLHALFREAENLMYKNKRNGKIMEGFDDAENLSPEAIK